MLLNVQSSDGRIYEINVDKPDITTVEDIKKTIGDDQGIPTEDITLSANMKILKDRLTVNGANLTTKSNLIVYSPCFSANPRADGKQLPPLTPPVPSGPTPPSNPPTPSNPNGPPTPSDPNGPSTPSDPSSNDNGTRPRSSSIEFAGYVVTSIIILMILFMVVSYAESAYNSVESLVNRLYVRRWKLERPPVFIEIFVFLAVLICFAVLMWKLAIIPPPAKPDPPSQPTIPSKPKPPPVPPKKDQTQNHKLWMIMGVIVAIIIVVAVALSSDTLQKVSMKVWNYTGRKNNYLRDDWMR
jgi:hypothetical protein